MLKHVKIFSILLFISLSLHSQTHEIELNANGITFPRLTSSDRDGMNPMEGQCIYNLDDNQIQCYDGSSWQSLSVTITTHPNILIGNNAGDSITTGVDNIAIGNGALQYQKELDGSVAIGYQTLQNNGEGATESYHGSTIWLLDILH